MRSQGALARRSVAEWVVRGGLAVAAALIGFLSVTSSLGYMVRSSSPERAYHLAPMDGRVAAMLAQRRSGPEATPGDRLRADELARLALKQEPTAVIAASTLGLNAQARGDNASARRFFAYSQTLSRRDLQTQVWAIEAAVARGDIAGALRHYDIALRASRNAIDLLFPVLGSAIADPDVRAALVRTLSAAPAWQGTFLDYVSGNGPDASATVNLFLALRRAGVFIPNGAGATIVSTLVSQNRMDLAWRYYAATHPGSDPRRTRDPNFSARPPIPSPFDWIMSDEGVTGSLQQGEHGGVVEFSAPSGIGGPVLRQVQVLPPGQYRFDGKIAKIEGEGNAPYWVLQCRSGRELGRIETADKVTFVGEFYVPAECPVQVLMLMVRPSDAIAGTSGQVTWARVSSVGRSR